ncbi:tRNA lysidine(34) synthetase TilS [Polynucleobacter paneuropaeus]|nr:tRNA lysidine(34) synthetase TilS [Polynucleobacter paneuropaeus]
MANSRKSPQSPKPGKRIAVALSGGLDSVVLLDTVCKAQAFQSQNIEEIWALHIHHGLQKPADEWLEFCEKLTAQYQKKKYPVAFDFRLLHLNPSAEGNIEARARTARYEALADLCAEHQIEDLLLAHHQNDQAETVLLQLLRGAGVAGLSAMPSERMISLDQGPITIWRPLLGEGKEALEAYAKANQLKWIEDPSNQSTRYRRNAIRKDIIPRLGKIQPEAIANLARSAQLLGDAQFLLDRLAQADGKTILNQDHLQLKPLLELHKNDLPAANNVLRYWLKLQNLAMPSQERLQSWWSDLQTVGANTQLKWLHDDHEIVLWRGQLSVVKMQEQHTAGQWVFTPLPLRSKTLGLSLEWVNQAKASGSIEERQRSGAERLQLKSKTPRKTLKNLFQENAIPPWQRQAPLLFIDGQLIAVAGLGVSFPHLIGSGKRVLPEWQPAQ